MLYKASRLNGFDGEPIGTDKKGSFIYYQKKIPRAGIQNVKILPLSQMTDLLTNHRQMYVNNNDAR